MNEKTKPENKTPENRPEEAEKETWAKDQSEHKYYYDDAYGYEPYHTEDDENDDEQDLPKTC